MRKILSLLTAVLFAGAMMATDVEVIIHASSGDYYAKTNNWQNGTQYDQVVLDANITANRIGSGNNGKYYSDWRFYTNGSDSLGSFSIDAADGYELQSIKITWSAGNSGALYMGETLFTSNTAFEVSGQHVVFKVKNTNAATNGQAKVTKIAVTYQATQGGGDDPQPQPATTKTVYCKMTQSWWTVDGAAVGVHYWGGESTATNWPGVRMAAVEGQEGTWTYDVPADVEGLIFVRVNGSGDIADWGAKTENLILPTDGKNLFTITNETESWGDPGCTGVWSVYGEGGDPEPQPQDPILANGYYLVGNFNGWAPAANYALSVNPDNEAEYMVEATLVEADSLKVVALQNDVIVTWYPSGDNYVVDAAHAGTKTVYFRPDYQGGEDWFASCIYIAANEEPIDPQPAGDIVYSWSSNAAEQIGVTAYGTGVGADNVKIHTNTDNVPGIKFGNSYSYEGGKFLAIKPAEGGFLEGDVVSIAVCFNNADETKKARIMVYGANGTDSIYCTDNGVNGRTSAEDPEVETFVLAANQDSLLLGRNGNTATYIVVLQVVRRGGEPQPQPQLADGFYLIGQNGWDMSSLSADLKFEPTEANPSEYVLNATLVEGQGIKVVKVENDEIVTWYPGGMGNEYIVDAAHAGIHDIYFQETYKEDWAAFGGYIWIGANEETGVTNIDAAKAVKVIRNGQVIILRGENKYTVCGQVVK